MKRTIKKLFPWLVTLRKNQRIKSFYKKMEKDDNNYSKEIVEVPLQNTQFEDKLGR